MAGEGDKKVGVLGGLQTNILKWERHLKMINFLGFIEFEKKYNNSYELYLDVTIAAENKNYILGVAYKSVLWRGKNKKLRWRGNFGLGTGGEKINIGLGLGLEFIYTFRNKFELNIQQKNDFIFLKKNKIQNGFIIGFTIPIN